MLHWITPRAALKHIGRYNRIIAVFIKYGFGEFFQRIRIWEYRNIERRLFKRRPHEFPHLSEPERLRLALAELGPTFVKLGQMLSTRPDIMGHEFIVELEKLQEHAEFISVTDVRKVILAELGRPIEDVFDSFSDEPLAAASLAQVHRAVLNGEEVVLKVQRPDITGAIQIDLEIMHFLATLWERYSTQAYYIRPVGLVEEFTEDLKRELDFELETNNMIQFARNFDGDETLHVPDVYQELSTRKMIVMEFIDGISISSIQRLTDEGYDLTLIARRGADISFRAALEFGFFHSDPHPGNLLVLPGNVISLLDFGQMGTMSSRNRERMARLVYFIGRGDENRVARALLGLMESEDIIDAEELEAGVANIVVEYGNVPLSKLRLGAMLLALLRLLMSHRVRFYTPLIWITKGVSNMEDIAHRLGADFSMIEIATPYAEKIFSRKLNPFEQLRESYFWLIDSLEFVKDLPYDASILLRQLKKGRVKIEFEHMGLEPIQRTISRTSNRIALTILIASLLVASSVIVLSGMLPLVGDMPALGLAGFIAAAILSVFLLFSVMFRSD